MAQRARGGSHRRGWRAGVALAVAVAMAVGAAAIWRAGDTTGGTELVEHQAEASSNVVDGEAAPHDATAPTGDDATQSPALLVVDVDGAVTVPGVYEIPAAQARVRDAVAAAGGRAADADPTQRNHSAALHGGCLVYTSVAAPH